MTDRTCPGCGASHDRWELCDCDGGTLPAIQCTQPPVIFENLHSVSRELETICQTVSTMPKSEASLKQVRDLRAAVRKRFELLEDQRKAVKKAVLEPYQRAMETYTAFVSDPFRQADNYLKAWVDDYQIGIKQSCEQLLRDYFNELCAHYGIDFLEFEDCGVTVDMATARQKEPAKAMDKISDYVDSVHRSILAIQSLPDAEEILSVYKQCKDSAKAITIVEDRHKSILEAREYLRQCKEAADRKNAQTAQLICAAPELSPEICTVTFRASGTLEALRQMKAFAQSLGITLESEE